MQQMSEAVWQLVIAGGLLGLLVGFGIAFWAADDVYWKEQRKGFPRITRPRLRRLRSLGIARNPGGVRWVSDWYTGTSRIGEPGLVVKDGQVLVVDICPTQVQLPWWRRLLRIVLRVLKGGRDGD